MSEPPHEHLLDRAEQAFATLPGRYRGAPPGFAARYRIELTDIGRTWLVEVDAGGCRVTEGGGGADSCIATDAATWLALRDGELSGIEAFNRGRLEASGNLHLAICFEGLFELPGGRPPRLRMRDVPTGKGEISTLTAGDGDEVAILIHGLGSNKTSMLETLTALGPDFTAHAIDLPGFGESSKPARAPYDPAWFARAVVRLLDALEVDRAHLIGNSMGGRVSIEVGLTAPERVSSINLLAPSLAWRRRRELASVLRLVPSSVAAIPHPVSSLIVRRQLSSLFARPERVNPAMAEAAASEFVRTYGQSGARVALLASARNIVLEEPFGPTGFWDRLGGLRPPTQFIWGEEDPLVPIAFARHVRDELPGAAHAVLPECGHVPQIEQPERTHELIRAHIDRARPARNGSRNGSVIRLPRREGGRLARRA